MQTVDPKRMSLREPAEQVEHEEEEAVEVKVPGSQRSQRVELLREE